MDLFSMFKGGKYFDKHIAPKCDYCQFGRRARDGNKVLCEKRGLVDSNYSCNKFIYSPLKRIPVKQLNFVGSLADEDIYIESAGDIAEKKELENPAKKAEPKKEAAKKQTTAPAEAPKTEPVKQNEASEQKTVQNEAPKQETVQNEAPKQETVQNEAPKQETVQNEAPKQETVQNEAPKQEAVQNEAPKAEPVQTEIETLKNNVITDLASEFIANNKDAEAAENSAPVTDAPKPAQTVTVSKNPSLAELSALAEAAIAAENVHIESSD